MNKEKKQELFDLKEKAHNFAKILAPLYKIRLWKWGSEIPDAEKIENHICRLIDDLVRRNTDFVSCGGIIIRYNSHFKLWELLFQIYFDAIDFEQEQGRQALG